jgi:hypothetical protein
MARMLTWVCAMFARGGCTCAEPSSQQFTRQSPVLQSKRSDSFCFMLI